MLGLTPISRKTAALFNMVHPEDHYHLQVELREALPYRWEQDFRITRFWENKSIQYPCGTPHLNLSGSWPHRLPTPPSHTTSWAWHEPQHHSLPSEAEPWKEGQETQAWTIILGPGCWNLHPWEGQLSSRGWHPHLRTSTPAPQSPSSCPPVCSWSSVQAGFVKEILRLGQKSCKSNLTLWEKEALPSIGESEKVLSCWFFLHVCVALP